MKKFLIIGNLNAISYKEIFPLIKDNKIWLGCSLHAIKCHFLVDDSYESTNTFIDTDGLKKAKVNNAVWYTNLDHKKRHEKLELYKKYSPEEFPKYDNYDAIEVSRTKDIPKDYDGVMGVPISFLNKWCPEQFKIVDARDYDLNNKCDEQSARPFIEGNEIYRRVLIKHSHPNPLAGGGQINGKITYKRIPIIRVKKDESNIIL